MPITEPFRNLETFNLVAHVLGGRRAKAVQRTENALDLLIFESGTIFNGELRRLEHWIRCLWESMSDLSNISRS